LRELPSPRHRRAAARVLAALCLLAPCQALLWVPWYAKEEPALAGIPFFYTYQLIWVPLTVALMAVAHLLLRYGSRRDDVHGSS